jgi:hypothetical protein
MSTMLEGVVKRALDALLPDGAPSRSPIAMRDIIEKCAHDAYHAGQMDAAFDLHSVDDVAAELDVTPSRVRALATSRGVGAHIGRGETWIFQRADIEAMRDRKPGRPTDTEYWRAGSLMALDGAIADRPLAPIEREALNKRFRAARFGRTTQSDQDLLELLREFCPNDDHVTSYPGFN